MNAFLTFVETHQISILLLLLSLLVLTLMTHWLAWAFAYGRFRNVPPAPTDRKQDLRFVLSDAAVKIINDFRHLLALLIILIFAFALIFSLIHWRGSITEMKDALQAVVSAFGGLVGSIIGYYFGVAATKAGAAGGASGGSAGASTNVGESQPAGAAGGPMGAAGVPPITPAPPPPDNVLSPLAPLITSPPEPI
ncbi:MAG: hypothetical protein ACJ74W_03415 [Pyrinomonadaceae bacterium]